MGGNGLLNPRSLILLFVAMLIVFALLPSLFTEISDFSALAVLGSFSGGSTLALVIGTVLLAGLVLGVVDTVMGGRATAAIGRRIRGRR